MTKNVTLRRPKLLDLDQLLLWENNLENSLYSDNPIFYTIEQIEEFLTSDQDIFLDRKIRFMIDSSGSSVGCVDLFEYDMVNSRAGVGIFIDEKYRNRARYKPRDVQEHLIIYKMISTKRKIAAT